MKPSLDEAVAAIDDQGWVVLSDVAPMGLFDKLQARLDDLLADNPTGRNDFEGLKTQRVHNLLAKGDVFQHVAANDQVLDVVEAVLGEHFQVSVIQAIHILPGETVQGWHRDDDLFPLPWPHPPVVLNTMWAITDFTAQNGATRLVSGSHRWDDHDKHLNEDVEVAAAEMPRGSVLAWLGNLAHEGGANRTDAPRTGITMNYNQAWLRQQENQYLSLPEDLVRSFPERVQRLVGWDVHPPFIGHAEGSNPLKRLKS